MAITPVQKISIFFHKDEIENLMTFLQDEEILEIKKESLDFYREFYDDIQLNYLQKNKFSDQSSYLSKLEKIIGVLGKYETKKNYLEKFNDKIFVDKTRFYDTKTGDKIRNLCDKIELEIKELEIVRSKIHDISEQIKEISPWQNLKVGLDELIGTTWSRTLAGLMPKDSFFEFNSLLSEKAVFIAKISETEKDVYFLTISTFDSVNEIKNSITKFGKLVHWEALEFTPEQIFKDLQRYSHILAKRDKKYLNNIKKNVSYLPELKIEYDKIYNDWLKTKLNDDIFFASEVGVISGWIREIDLAKFEEILEANFHDTCCVKQLPTEVDQVPVAFDNSKIVEPFEIITDLYGRPQYSGIDPTPNFSFFFFLFFGICFGDAGYGLILIVISILGKFYLKSKKTLKKATDLLGFMGLSTFIIGIITGSFFGNLVDFLPQSLIFIKDFFAKFVLLNPADEKGSLIFLMISLALGYVQICYGILLKIYLFLRDKKYKALIFDGLPSIGMQLSLLPITLNYVLGIKFLPIFLSNFFVFFLLISIIIVIYREWKNNEGVAIKLFWCLYANYSMITGTFLSDVLSYARLFALGLSGGLMGLAINEISNIFGGIPVVGGFFVFIVLIGGHLFNFAINIMGAFVHSCRLQYLEFFTKFFESGGRPMQFFGKSLKYTTLKQEK